MRSASGHEKSSSQKSFLSSRRTSTSTNSTPLRGIHINISSDPFQHRIPPYIQRLWQESKLRKHLSVWRRRLIKRYQHSGWLEIIVLSVCIFSSCILLLVHVGFFSGKKYQDWQNDHYNKALDEVDVLDKVYPNEGRSLTTAIIVTNNNEGEQVQPILKELCQYDMFANFIIWNDDPDHNMTLSMIETVGCTPNKLSIINAPAKMGSSARYYACRLSKTPYCYFQDIPRTSQKLRSTYANFLRSPHLIHGESSNHDSFVKSQWRYCFSNPELGLHTCFVDMESGTFVAKAMITKFLDNYDKSSVVDEFADMYFIMYINQVPYQLEGEGTYTKELTQNELEHMDLGLTILYNDLEEDEGVVPLQPNYLETHFDRNARSSCKDDRCLFLTNKQVLPSIDLFIYNPTIDVDLSKEMHDDYYVNYEPDHKYARAVDSDDQTSWKSISNIRVGDYIGLDLLMPMRTPLKYRFLVRHTYAYKSSMAIQISYDGLVWIKLHPAPNVVCQNIDDAHTEKDGIKLLECQFIVTDTGYRYIRLESQKDMDYGFEVYDLSFNARMKKDANGQLLGFELSEDGIVYVEDN